jgi:hypothetical protein
VAPIHPPDEPARKPRRPLGLSFRYLSCESRMATSLSKRGPHHPESTPRASIARQASLMSGVPAGLSQCPTRPRPFPRPVPDYAEFIIGPAEGRTRWLHPATARLSRQAGRKPRRRHFSPLASLCSSSLCRRRALIRRGRPRRVRFWDCHVLSSTSSWPMRSSGFRLARSRRSRWSRMVRTVFKPRPVCLAIARSDLPAVRNLMTRSAAGRGWRPMAGRRRADAPWRH